MKFDILRYYAFLVLSSLLFFLPVDVLFFQERGLNLTEIFLIQSIFAIGIVALEVPTGAIADYFGRKISILMGILIWIISCLVFAFGWGFPVLVVAYLLWSLGTALLSGADTALLYDILHKNKEEKSFKKYQGMAKLLGLIAISVSALAGGYIASFSLGWTFLASAIAFTGCFFLITSISHQEEKNEQKESYLKTITDTFNLIKSTKWILWLFVFYMMFGVIFKLFQPLLQVYLSQVSVDIKFFGAVFTYLFLTGAIASKLAHSFEAKTKRFVYLILAILLTLGIFLISFFITKWGFLLFGIIYFACAINSIVIEHEVLKATPKQKHATVLSFNNLFFRAIFAGSAPVFGYYLQSVGIEKTVVNTGLIISFLFVILFLGYFSISKSKLQIVK